MTFKHLVPAVLLAAACGEPSTPPELGTTEQHVWTNGDFESDSIGTMPPTGWTVNSFTDPSITDTRPGPQTLASLNLAAGGTQMTFVVGGAPESQNDPDVGPSGTLHYPKYGNRAARVNYQDQTNYGNNQNVNSLTQQMTADLGDVDPTDNKVHVRFAVAPVLENPSHGYTAQPYYFVRLQNLSRGTTLYQDFNASGQPGVPWKNFTSSHGQPAQYTDWQLVDISPGNASLAVGDNLELKVIASGCSAGGHFGRVYVDAVGSGIPGLYTWATGVQQANAGTDITYTMNYKNGGTTTVTGTTLDLVTPPNTTFQSFSGASCTAPSAGSTGTVSCSLGTLAPGATGSYTITVNINAGTANGTVITNGTYQIEATGVSALIGPKVNTTVTSNVQYSDLSITKTDGIAAIAWGQATTYTIVVGNNGPLAASATVSDTMPAQLTGVTWSCTGSGGGTCTASGSGNISDAVSLPVGAQLTYTVNASIIAGSGTSSVVNTATVAATGGTTDPDSTNDTAVDTNTIGTLRTLTVTKQGATSVGTVTTTPAAISCGSGCTSDSADFLDGSQVVLTAAPDPGATFVGWGGACSGTQTTCTVTMSAALGVTASFAGAPATTTVSSGSPQTTAVSTAFTTPLAVLVADAGGVPVPGVTVAFAAPGSGASATLSAASAVTDANGIASVTATANATAGTYTVTGTVTGVAPVASFSLGNLGVPASIAVSSGSGQSATVDAAFANLVAIVRDAANQPVSGATVTFAAPGSGATALLGATQAITDASGLATVSATAGQLAGSYSVTASVGALTPATFSLTNTAGAATTLQVSSGSGQSAVVHTAFAASLVAKAVDIHGNAVSGVSVTFVPPGTPATASVSPTSGITNASGLVSTTATASDVTGGYTVSATASNLTPASFSLTNTPGAPASITRTGGNAQTAVVHTAFAQALTALVKDTFGNVVPGATVTFAAPGSGASATVPSAVTDGSGVASTTATANGTAGGFVVTASIAGGASVLFSLTNAPGTPSTVSITGGGGQSAVVAVAFALPITVLVVDDDANPVPGTTVTLTGPASGAGIATTPVTATTAANGVASFPVTANHTTGSYLVSAAVSGVVTQPTATLTNTPGTATTIAVVSGNNQHALVTTAFASPLVVVTTDSFGNIAPGTQVTFSAPGSGASASLSPTTATTGSNGRTSTAPTAGTVAGSYSVTAAITGTSTTFTLTNDHGAASAISVASGDNQSTTVNTAFGSALVAHVSDAQGNAVPGATVTFTPPVTGARATLGSSTAVTDAGGNAQTTATANTVSGAYAVSASLSGGASTSFSLTNLAGTPTTVSITAGGPQSTVVGTVFPQLVSVRVLDQFDNPVPAANVLLSGPATGASLASTVSLTTNSAGTASGSVTANHTAGTFALSAAVGGVVGASTVQLTNTPGTAAAIAVVAGNGQHTTVTLAFAARLVVFVSDSFGNAVTGATVSFSAPASGASATLSPTSAITASNGRTNIAATANTRAGTYSVTASITGASTTFTLTNDAGAPAAIAVASGDNQSATVATGFAAPLVAHVTDAQGNDVPGAQVTFAAPGTGARATLATPTVTTSAAGLAQTAATAGQITGAYSVSASVTGAVPVSFHLTNTAGAVATLTTTGGGEQSTVVTTAFAAPLAVHAADQFGNAVPGATITYSAPATGATATFPGAATATTNASGDAQIIATAGTIAGSYAARAATGSAPPASFALTNLPGAPAQIAATSGTPQSTVVATAFAIPLTVTVTDAHDNPVPAATVHFDPANTPATATPSAATAITDGNGVASITATASTAAGSHDLVASIDGASATFHLSNTADAPASIATVETSSPQATTVLHAFARPLAAVVRDRFGNPAPSATVTFSVPEDGASATLSSDTATTDATGTAMVNATANATAGAYIAHAAVDGVTEAAPFALTNRADTAATLSVASGEPQSAVVNTDFAAPLVALVLDGHGNPVPNVVVEFTAPGSDATATLGASSAISDAAGHAAVSAHASTTTGAYVITAALSDASSPITFRLTNTAGAPATITASPSSTPQAAQVDHPFSQPLIARVRDVYDNAVPGATVTFAAPETGATGSLSSTTATTESDGTASVTIDAGTIAGSYAVTASVGSVETPATFSLSNLAGEAHTITVSAGAPQSTTVATGFATPLVALVQDSHGNPVPEVAVVFTAPASGPGGTLEHDTVTTGLDGMAATGLIAGTIAGDFTVTATAPDTAAPALFALTALPGAPTTATAAASASPQSAEVGHAFGHPLAVTVVDAYGNPVPGATVTYQAPAAPGTELSATTATTDASGAASVLAIADATAGSYTVTATVAEALDVSFALTNTAAAPSSVVITGGGAQRTLATTAFAAPVTARVLDTFGNPVPGTTVTFSVPATGATATMSNAMPVTDDAGDVSITLTAGPVVGAFALTATAPGALSAATATLEALAIPTTITLTAAAANTVDAPISVTITVSASLGVPAGTVDVLDGDTRIGTVTLAGGSATFSATGLAMGHHSLVARYAAQGSYDASTSAAVPVDVTKDSGSLSGGGDGGCSTGGGNSLWLVAGLAALVLRRRRRAAAGLVVAGLALHVAPASAEPDGSRAINRYHAASPDSVWFALDSASFAGDEDVRLSVVTEYAKDPLETFDSNGTVREHVVTDQLTFQLGASLTLREVFRLSSTVVMVPWQSGNGGTFNGMPLSTPTYAFGDVVLAGDMRLYGDARGPLRIVGGARFALPTGSRSNFTSDGTLAVEPHLLVAGSLGILEYAGGAGAFLRSDNAMAGEQFGSELRYQLALGARLAGDRVLIGPELFGAAPLEDGTAIGTPLEGELGAHFAASPAVRVGVAAGVGLVNAIGQARWRTIAQLTWTP